jgi:hypothetical protein
MKGPTIEQLLISCIDSSSSNNAFVERVMSALPSHPEIFSHQLRIVDDQPQKKGSFMTRFRALPVPLLVVTILGAALLIGGTSYAAYVYLWKPAHVKIGSQNMGPDGHAQTRVALANCAAVPQSNLTIETKRNTDLAPEAIKSRLQAQCEFNAVEAYMSALPQPGSPAREGYAIEPCSMTMPSHLGSSLQTPACLSVISSRDHMIDGDTKYISNGVEVEATAINPGSTIMLITHNYFEPDTSSSSPRVSKSRVKAVIELSLPVDSYTYLGASIAYRSACHNNPSDTCLSHIASELVYMRTDLPESVHLAQYEGRVTSVHDDTIIMKTSSGRFVTLTMPAGTLSQFSAKSPKGYKIAVGDLIQFVADTPLNGHKSSFHATELSEVDLVLDIDEKTHAESKY